MRAFYLLLCTPLACTQCHDRTDGPEYLGTVAEWSDEGNYYQAARSVTIECLQDGSGKLPDGRLRQQRETPRRKPQTTAGVFKTRPEKFCYQRPAGKPHQNANVFKTLGFLRQRVAAGTPMRLNIAEQGLLRASCAPQNANVLKTAGF